MLKLTGAAAILCSALLAAVSFMHGERGRLEDIATLRALLLRLRRDICERMLPLPEIIASLKEDGDKGCAALFIRVLSERMERIGDEELASIWSAAAEETLSPLGEKSALAVRGLALVVGGSDTEALSRAVELCCSELAAEESGGRARLKERSRLCVGLAMCAGIFTVIMLV